MENPVRVFSYALLVALLVSAPVSATPAGEEPPVPDEIVSPSSVGEVVFPHRKHFEELGLPCTDCHHETQATVLKMPHPDYFADFWIDCKICHRKAGPPLASQSCSACHHSSVSNIADQTLSAKVVIHRSCWRCHPVDTGEKAAESCAFCHNRQRIATPAAVHGTK